MGSLVAEILGVCVRSEDVDVLVRETLDTTIIHVFEDYDVVIFIDAIRNANVEKPCAIPRRPRHCWSGVEGC